jgi:hypothetical protein
MFLRKLRVQKIAAQEQAMDSPVQDCPIHWIDNFAMRNFTNDAILDDTLPIADGWMEAGTRVPLPQLRDAMEDWFRRKGYLKPEETLVITEIPGA